MLLGQIDLACRLAAATDGAADLSTQTSPEGVLDVGLQRWKLTLLSRSARVRDVERAFPDEDVQTLDLVDEHLDRTSGGGDFRSLIAPQPGRPFRQEAQLVVVESLLPHRTSVRPNRVACGQPPRSMDQPDTPSDSATAIHAPTAGMRTIGRTSGATKSWSQSNNVLPAKPVHFQL